MSKLDDLLGNKKEIVPILDLSKIIVHSKDEYKRLCEKVPDYKMRPIKVRQRREIFYLLKSITIDGPPQTIQATNQFVFISLPIFQQIRTAHPQVRTEDIKIKDLERGLFKPAKKELKYLQRNNGDRERQYIYMDPVPNEMRSLILMELCTVQIDWKMLTTLRPKTKIEEEYYSKCVHEKQFVHFA